MDHGANFRSVLFASLSRRLRRKDPMEQTGLVSMQMRLGRGRETETIITRHEVGTTAIQLFRLRETLRRRCTTLATSKSRQTETDDGGESENSLPQEDRLSEEHVFHGLTGLCERIRANKPFFSCFIPLRDTLPRCALTYAIVVTMCWYILDAKHKLCLNAH